MQIWADWGLTMNGFHYLMGAVYCTPCDFASIEGFEDLVEPRFSDLPFERDPVAERVKSTIAEFEGDTTDRIDARKALLLLVAQDLRNVLGRIESTVIHNPDESLPRHRDIYDALLRSLGLSFSPPKLFIVDTFPKPYDKMDWVATSPDQADERDYGIVPGNYFKRAHLVPFRSDFLLAHEMIHQVIGEVDPNLLGRGLEEGIAVVFGELYVGAQVLGASLAQLYAGYHWFDRRASQGNRLYAEYARMAALIYQMHGLDGLIALVQSGRPKIKQVEQSLLGGKLDLDLPSGNWNREYTQLVQRVTMATVANLAVSPLARYIAPHAQVGATYEQISSNTGVSLSDVAQALDELQQQAVVIMTNESRVDYSDVDLLVASHSLRYDV
jgi:hypothetical protein